MSNIACEIHAKYEKIVDTEKHQVGTEVVQSEK